MVKKKVSDKVIKNPLVVFPQEQNSQPNLFPQIVKFKFP